MMLQLAMSQMLYGAALSHNRVRLAPSSPVYGAGTPLRERPDRDPRRHPDPTSRNGKPGTSAVT